MAKKATKAKPAKGITSGGGNVVKGNKITKTKKTGRKAA